jgi:hypothetical protein
MLNDYITDVRIVSFSEIPFLWILYEILAVGTSVVFVVKGSNGVDARLEIFS